MRRLVLFLTLLLSYSATAVFAQEPARVEVVEVSGIIDGSVERSVLSTIEQAESSGDTTLVILRIDSRGVVDAARGGRITRAIRNADVPIATWVGPAGARAEHGAALVVAAGRVRAIAPGAGLAGSGMHDLRRRHGSFSLNPDGIDELVRSKASGVYELLGADAAEEAGLVDYVAPSLADLLDQIDPEKLGLDEDQAFDDETTTVRFRKLDLFGRMMHAAAQPSITYLLLLIGLVGVVFELFHPSTGPAGISGLAALAFAGYGVVTLGGSWLGVALIVAGVAGFAVDLRYQALGWFTLAGFAGLIAGSLLLFPGPWLEVSPWILALGITGMVAFLLGAMTRVLRDLRAIARGELQVTDAHPHPNGQTGDAHAP